VAMLSAILAGPLATPSASAAMTDSAAGHKPTASPASTLRNFRGPSADDGAYVASETWLNDQELDLKISSPAVGATVSARLLLPPQWSRTASRRWPVLYLLHGGHDDYTSWTRETNIESFARDKNVLVVMPSAGPTGIPTRWQNDGGGAPDYESFDVDELMQLLERDYHASALRAVAGVSTGGYGAVAMAAHYPGAFAAAAAYSGILDITATGIPAFLFGIVARENLNPQGLWGDITANEALWKWENPADQVAGLRGTSLFISAGDGHVQNDQHLGNFIEQALWPQAMNFIDAAESHGISLQTDLYSGGTHNWSSWKIEFARSWQVLAKALGLSG
jgi:diacylglycerol O-acyltransferase / trehalose O-mycolyltransferase